MLAFPHFALPILIAVNCLATRAGGESVLEWAPGKGDTPALRLSVEPFKVNDVGRVDLRYGEFSGLSAILDVFAGEDEELRRQFGETFSHYTRKRSYPRYTQPERPDATVATYLLPYEYDQGVFLDWMERFRGGRDFFSERGRRWNPHLEDLVAPLTNSVPDDDFLRSTMGRAVMSGPQELTLFLDTRYFPGRWMTPLNEIHHNEQPSLCVTIDVDPGQRPRVADAIRRRWQGEGGERVLLRYDVTLALDFHDDMEEETIFDFHGGDEPPGDTLTGVLHRNTMRAIEGNPMEEGVQLQPVRQRDLLRFVETRLIPTNFQLSLMVLFNPRFQLAEFMLAEYQQAPCAYPPPSPGDEGFLPTANLALNQYVSDGGNAGSHAWTRVPIDVFRGGKFTEGGSLPNPILEATPYLNLESPENTRARLRGEIDITDYYHTARRTEFFPGQRGYWGHQWVGFEGDAEEYQNPDVVHDIRWIGLIFEASGAMRVEVDIHELDLILSPRETPKRAEQAGMQQEDQHGKGRE